MGRRANRPVLLDQLAEDIEESVVDLLVARELFEWGLAGLWEEQAVAEPQDDALGERAVIILQKRQLAQVADGLLVVVALRRRLEQHAGADRVVPRGRAAQAGTAA